MRRSFSLGAILVAVVLAGGAQPAAAYGAVAVGQTDTDDFIGWSVDYETERAARQAALGECRQNPAPAASVCEVVATFRNQCVAFAFEREGVTGFGWAIADSRRTAERLALTRCRASTVDPQRSGCELWDSDCDGSAR